MNLKNLSDIQLLQNTESLVRRECELLTEVLAHLREIERRRLFSSLGCTSLFHYAVSKLHYSEDQAYRRIGAMRMLKELPEVEEKISSGAISLTNMNMAQNLFRKEQFTHEAKTEILQNLENKSTREAKKIVNSFSRLPAMEEVKITVSEQVQAKLEKLKGLLAHAYPNISSSELIDKLCDLGLEKWDQGAQKTRVKQAHVSPRVMENKNPRYIPASARREVWQRAKSQCENCKSQYALEIEHKIPVAHGGASNPENLKLLCKSCNQRAAIQIFGVRKMEKYF